jgi:hypothetical protein
VSANALLAFVLVGAAVLALWTDARFPGAWPKRWGIVLVHLLASLAALHAAPSLMRFVPGVSESAGPATAALLGLFLPALVYTFVSAIWVIRTAQSALARG